MECDICGQSPSAKLPFHCSICARSALYSLRLEHAVVLADKDAMGQRVEGVVQGAGHGTRRESLSLSGAIIDTHDCAKAHELESIKSESAALSERVRLISERAKALNVEMEEHKRGTAEKKAAISQRRSDAESATYGREAREAKELDGVQAGIRRMRRRWEMKHDDIVVGRFSLCKEAARLAGLKRVRKSREDGSIREYYLIGDGLPVFDLRELHIPKPEELTASLTQLAYLTARVSTYLALRLPAEIILPHRDYPLPTIFNPQSSYTSHDMQFPAMASGHSSSNSPVTSRANDPQALPRPRPLFVQFPLPKFSKDDPQGFSMFVEGVTLLAWDIAWLCKAQGMSGLNSEADMCSVGRNLWNLLLDESKDFLSRKESASQDGKEPGISAPSVDPPAHVPTLFGQFSHGTAHSFFGFVGGREIMHNWKLQNPARSIDKIKDYLRSEIQKAEWEVVDGVGWDVDTAEDQPVLVGGRQYDKGGKSVGTTPPEHSIKGQSEAAAKPVRVESSGGPSPELQLTKTGPVKAASGVVSGVVGWTKVRTRNNSTAEASQKP